MQAEKTFTSDNKWLAGCTPVGRSTQIGVSILINFSYIIFWFCLTSHSTSKTLDSIWKIRYNSTNTGAVLRDDIALLLSGFLDSSIRYAEPPDKCILRRFSLENVTKKIKNL